MKIAALGVGILYALFCEAFAFMMVGGGHGWLTPFFCGPLGLIVFPLSFYAALAAREEGKPGPVVLGLAVLAAAGADLVVIGFTLNEGVEYFERLGSLAYFWIALWVGGQATLVYAFTHRFIVPMP